MCQRHSGNRQVGVACGNYLKRLKLKCFSGGLVSKITILAVNINLKKIVMLYSSLF